MKPPEQKTIGELEVYTQQLPARRAFRLSWKLGGIIPFVLAKLGPLSRDSDAKVLLPGLLELFGRLTVDEADELAAEILCCTSVIVPDGSGGKRKVDLTSPGKFDEAFTGRMTEFYATLAFALVVNFRDFIDGAFVGLLDAPPEAGAA